jgi:uncharacterized protein (DUF4213/DUF364 family)
MNAKQIVPVLEAAKTKVKRIVDEQGWHEIGVSVSVKTLSPEEAIGNPKRRDFPIVEGKERVIEVEVMDCKAQAFTDSPREFSGTIRNVLALPLDTNDERAIFIGTLNAILKSRGRIEATLHCKDEEPERCAHEITAYIRCKYGMINVGLVGLNPAIAESLVKTFGAEHVNITDLNYDNIGKIKYGVTVQDGRTGTKDMVKASDLILMTGTTMVNNTFDGIRRLMNKYNKEYLIYGVTASGINELLDFQGICPYGRK